MSQPMTEYARRQAATLLDRLAYQVGRAVKRGDEETIHDLRVSIRRFAQCLRVFRQFFPAAKKKKVRRKLRAAMRLAAQVRDCDIALELTEAPARSKLTAALRQRREADRRLLLATMKTWHHRNFSRRWRDNLEL